MSYFVDFTNGPMKAIRFRTGLDFCPYVYYIARMGKYVPRHVQELANSYEKKFRILRTKGGLDKALLDFEIELFKKYKVALVRLNFFDLSFYQDDKIMSTIEGIETGDLEYVGMFDDYDELDRQTRTLKNKVRDGSEFNENSEDEDNENSDNDSDDFDVPEEELEMARSYMLGDMCRTYESPFSLSDAWMLVETSGLDCGFYERSIAAIRETTAEDILQLARKYFCKENLIEVVAGKKV